MTDETKKSPSTRITKENVMEVSRHIVKLIQEGHEIKVFDSVPDIRYDILLWNHNERNQEGNTPLTTYFLCYEDLDLCQIEADKLSELLSDQANISKLIVGLFLSQFKIWGKEGQRELVGQQ